MMNPGNLQATTAALEAQQHQQISGSGMMTGPPSSSMPTSGPPSGVTGSTAGGVVPLAPRAPSNSAMMLAGQQQQQQQQLHHPGAPTSNAVPAHLIGLMTNPTLAAAAAASPLFPPAALLSNPGAYLSMPDAYAAGAMQAAAAAAAAATSAAASTSSSSRQQPGGMSAHPFASAGGGAGAGGLVLTQASLNGMNPFLVGMPATSLPMPTMASSADLTAAYLDDGGSRKHGGGVTTVVTGSGPLLKGASGQQQLPHHHPGSSSAAAGAELTVEERQQQNRDRNREHARSTRLRKKAYVAKLKELVEGLHAERTEEVRQRRIAIQSLSEMQNVRRGVVRSFLRYYAAYEVDERKWGTLLEEKFSLKQPVTPYRSFRSSEIEKAHHYSRGLASLLCDAASLSVMIESIGSKSPRWMQRKREELMLLEAAKRGTKNMPSCVVRQDSRLQHAISSLSSSSGSSNHASSGEEGGDAANNNNKRNASHGDNHGSHGAKHSSSTGRYLRPMLGMLGRHEETANMVGTIPTAQAAATSGAAKVSSSSGSGSSSNDSRVGGSNNSSKPKHDASNDFHDYHAQPLDDPEPAMLDSDRNSSTSADDDSPVESNLSENTETKRITTDSSSGDDSATTAAAEADPPAHKRRKVDSTCSGSSSRLSAGEAAMLAATPHAPTMPSSQPHPAAQSSGCASIAKKGGIPHNIKTTVAASERGVVANGAARLGLVAPAVPLRPFAGIGKSRKRGNDHTLASLGGKNGVLSENDTSSVSSSSTIPQIRVSFHINEDDMILMDDVLMCPFTFRTQDAVICGALSECVMPGMLRAHFSERNKLLGLELVYDAMGFMQQLERASGREGAAQVIPSTLEMALSPTASDARVITTAKPPFQIVNVNDVWTQITGYTQMEVEGESYLSLMEGDGTVPQANERQGKPKYDLEEVAKGRSACTTNIHYDKAGNDFMEYVCSYPLTNSSGEVTHLLHVSSELPSYHGTLMDQ